MTKREQRLAVITLVIVALSVGFAYVYVPLSRSRAAAQEELPLLEARLDQVQGMSTRSRRLARENERLLEQMGAPDARLVPYEERFDARKKLVESLQSMDWDKPYNISSGNLERGEVVDRITYHVDGKVPWDHVLNKIAELENYEYLNKVEHVAIHHEGKVRLTMRVTLFLAPEGMEPPPEPEAEPDSEPEPESEEKGGENGEGNAERGEGENPGA